jgi:hypothetical protein
MDADATSAAYRTVVCDQMAKGMQVVEPSHTRDSFPVTCDQVPYGISKGV